MEWPEVRSGEKPETNERELEMSVGQNGRWYWTPRIRTSGGGGGRVENQQQDVAADPRDCRRENERDFT